MRLIAAAAIAAIVATPAFAGSMTLEFTRDDDGTSQTWKLNDDGTTAGPDGATGVYTWDDEAKKLCGTIDGDKGGERCMMMSEISNPDGEPAVGDTAKYAMGEITGKVKIVAIEE